MLPSSAGAPASGVGNHGARVVEQESLDYLLNNQYSEREWDELMSPRSTQAYTNLSPSSCQYVLEQRPALKEYVYRTHTAPVTRWSHNSSTSTETAGNYYHHQQPVPTGAVEIVEQMSPRALVGYDETVGVVHHHHHHVYTPSEATTTTTQSSEATELSPRSKKHHLMSGEMDLSTLLSDHKPTTESKEKTESVATKPIQPLPTRVVEMSPVSTRRVVDQYTEPSRVYTEQTRRVVDQYTEPSRVYETEPTRRVVEQYTEPSRLVETRYIEPVQYQQSVQSQYDNQQISDSHYDNYTSSGGAREIVEVVQTVPTRVVEQPAPMRVVKTVPSTVTQMSPRTVKVYDHELQQMSPQSRVVKTVPTTVTQMSPRTQVVKTVPTTVTQMSPRSRVVYEQQQVSPRSRVVYEQQQVSPRSPSYKNVEGVGYSLVRDDELQQLRKLQEEK